MTNIQLTDIDKRKIDKCQTYRAYKKVTLAMQKYKEFEVGTAIFIKRLSDGNYVSRGGRYSSIKYPPTKFVIIENDNGFLFAKRILTTGETGKDITCLTTDYGPDRFELVPDEAMVDAMLLDEEYDPSADAKEMKKKKNKASRLNSKNRIQFDDPWEAYNYVSSLKQGDKIWTASTSFGSNLAEYEVIAVNKKPVKDVSKEKYIYGEDQKHKYHQELNIAIEFVEAHIVLKSGGNRWTKTNKMLSFMSFCKDRKYGYYAENFYSKRPVTPEDL